MNHDYAIRVIETEIGLLNDATNLGTLAERQSDMQELEASKKVLTEDFATKVPTEYKLIAFRHFEEVDAEEMQDFLSRAAAFMEVNPAAVFYKSKNDNDILYVCTTDRDKDLQRFMDSDKSDQDDVAKQHFSEQLCYCDECNDWFLPSAGKEDGTMWFCDQCLYDTEELTMEVEVKTEFKIMRRDLQLYKEHSAYDVYVARGVFATDSGSEKEDLDSTGYRVRVKPKNLDKIPELVADIIKFRDALKRAEYKGAEMFMKKSASLIERMYDIMGVDEVEDLDTNKASAIECCDINIAALEELTK